VILWVASGAYFGYGEGWFAVINTGSSIVTFLVVFLIQNARKRDTEAIQIKLDEIIRATAGAHNGLLDMEHASEEERDAHRERYAELAAAARRTAPAIRPAAAP